MSTRSARDDEDQLHLSATDNVAGKTPLRYRQIAEVSFEGHLVHSGETGQRGARNEAMTLLRAAAKELGADAVVRFKLSTHQNEQRRIVCVASGILVKFTPSTSPGA